MDCKEIVFSRHAIQRMFKRSISTEEVRQVATGGSCQVVTVYSPDSDLWEPDFKRRKTP